MINSTPTIFTDTQKFLLNLLQVLQTFEGSEPSPLRANYTKYFAGSTPTKPPPLPTQHKVELIATLQKNKAELEALLGQTKEGGSVNDPFSTKPSPSFSAAFEGKNAPLLKGGKEFSLPLIKTTLIEEVRSAIRILSSSTYMADPDEAPTQKILEKIQPLLDHLLIVTEVEKSESKLPRHFTPTPKPLPRSPRSELFKALFVRPADRETSNPKGEGRGSVFSAKETPLSKELFKTPVFEETELQKPGKSIHQPIAAPYFSERKKEARPIRNPKKNPRDDQEEQEGDTASS